MRYILTILFCWPLLIWAQSDSVRQVKYTPEFKFKDGLYLNITQVRDNSPVPHSRIITSLNYNQADFFDKLLDDDQIAILDDLGGQVPVKVAEIWGYANHGVLFINCQGEFNRLGIVGSVCHFIANVTVVRDQYYNTSYYNPYETYPANATTNEMRQYILDFETGNVMDYSTESLKVILMRDPELYDEFNQLRRKKQRQLLFLYVRKYNEKHPLMLNIK